MKCPRYTQNQMEELFKQGGCELLDTYKNSKTPMKYKCECGNITKINWDNFKQGVRCARCGGCEKPTIEHIKSEMKKAGLICLSDEYKSKDLLQVRCEKGHTFPKSWHSFQQGHLCPTCGGSEKLTIEFVKSEIEKTGYVCLSTEYINSNTCLQLQCPNGHTIPMRWSDFKQGVRCFDCYHESKKFSYDYVKGCFSKQQCQLLTTKYTGCRQKLQFRCKCGGIGNTTLICFLKAPRCPKCNLKKHTGKNHWRWTEDRESLRFRQKMRMRCRNALKSTLEGIGQKKSDRSSILLGYTPNDLLEHVVSHPNWAVVKDDPQWELDHIFPIKAFCDYGLHDVSLINSLKNLQPLSHEENQKKNDKYNPEEFEVWLESMGVVLETSKGG